MKRVAITGTIGSGKSMCSLILKKLGYTVFDCDEVSKQLLQRNENGYHQVVKRFNCLNKEHEIDKECLASIVFNDTEAKQDLEAILHPLILNRMFEESERCKSQIFFAEVPLLFESNWQQYFDVVLVISVRDDIRISRMNEFRNMDKYQVMQRMKSQMSEKDKINKATKVIENNGNTEQLEKDLIEWLNTL